MGNRASFGIYMILADHTPFVETHLAMRTLLSGRGEFGAGQTCNKARGNCVRWKCVSHLSKCESLAFFIFPKVFEYPSFFTGMKNIFTRLTRGSIDCCILALLSSIVLQGGWQENQCLLGAAFAGKLSCAYLSREDVQLRKATSCDLPNKTSSFELITYI
jgi:hypothetical protein